MQCKPQLSTALLELPLVLAANEAKSILRA